MRINSQQVITDDTISWKILGQGDFSKEYWVADYYKNGDEINNGPVRVYFSKSEYPTQIPSRFNTGGYNGHLHFGCIWMGGDQEGFYFVLHSNENRPLQKQ